MSKTQEKRFGAPQEVRDRLNAIGGFTVAAKRCDACLFSSNRLVDKQRAAEIIRTSNAQDTYFVCHRFSVGGEQRPYESEAVCCRAFYDAYKTQPIRMAECFGIVRFVDDEGNEVKP